jgi:hypothetical protein
MGWLLTGPPPRGGCCGICIGGNRVSPGIGGIPPPHGAGIAGRCIGPCGGQRCIGEPGRCIG